MHKLKIAVATLAGAGYLPGAPGTWGSFFSLLLLYPLALQFGDAGIVTAILCGSALTLWTSEACERRWGRDPSRMVIDEFAGQGVTLLFIPFTGAAEVDFFYLAAGFLLFRLFDIFKPLGIKQLQDFPSGIGILLDDIVAGLYALACLYSGIWFISTL